MSLSLQEVDHIAMLARLHLTEEERKQAGAKLSQILEHFEKLNELNTDGVEPTSHVLPQFNVLREDEIRPGLSREAALQNAPEHAAGMFQVPRVVEAE